MDRLFESCVVLDGNQAVNASHPSQLVFESCVVLDGNQAAHVRAQYLI